MKLKKEKYTELVSLAKAARGASYSPYSHFSVGAALLCENGKLYKGTNVENSSFSATLCAERVAVFQAVADGERDFCAIAVVGGDATGESHEECRPCAVCLQVMTEFCDGDFEIVTEDGEGGIRVYTLSELLPNPFKFR